MSLEEPGHRNTRSKTELETWRLSKYLVEKNSKSSEISNWKESIISKRMSLWEEWCGKFGSQKWSLILTLVSFRYFKATWDESE